MKTVVRYTPFIFNAIPTIPDFTGLDHFVFLALTTTGATGTMGRYEPCLVALCGVGRLNSVATAECIECRTDHYESSTNFALDILDS
jgi:hypothetical protein